MKSQKGALKRYFSAASSVDVNVDEWLSDLQFVTAANCYPNISVAYRIQLKEVSLN